MAPTAWLALAIVLIAFGVFAAVGVVVAMALVLLKPPRMIETKALYWLRRWNPADLGMDYEQTSFRVRDSRTGQPIRIAGWWIPGPKRSDRCVMLIHGYTDAKVGSIAWAPMFRELGFNVLAIDLRAHGDSDGAYSTAGYFERDDVSQVIDQFRAERPEETAKLVLFGISLGAAVAAAVGAQRDDLAAVILECPYADFPSAVKSHAGRLGMPGPRFQDAALRVAQWIAGCDFAKVRPVDTIRLIPCPLMVIQACDDPFVPPNDIAAIAFAVAQRPRRWGRSESWQIPDCHHVIAYQEDPEQYREKIADFLAEAVPAERAGSTIQAPEVPAAN
jgi:alpha-beta hydrolase superfamily lysophospholipase